jgi:hypothetical protein
VTVKRSGKEGRWAELPPARTRFAAEAVFLILVAAGAALAKLSPLGIIGLMLVAWLLVALIERASSREQARALAGVEEMDVSEADAAPVGETAEEPAAEPEPRVGFRWAFWRRERAAVEPLAAPTAALEERPSRANVRKIEPETPPPVIDTEPETVVTEIVVAESPQPGPAVTKRPLELPGLEEPETVRASAPPPAEAPPRERPVERPAPPVEPVVEAPPEPPPVEQAPPPLPEPPRAPPAPRPPAREWNIWDLERWAREQAGDPLRDEEWAALFMHLRQYANADGVLPMQFDDLVRESFSELIQAA